MTKDKLICPICNHKIQIVAIGDGHDFDCTNPKCELETVRIHRISLPEAIAAFRLATRADKQGIQWISVEDGPPKDMKWGVRVLAYAEFDIHPDIVLTDELWLDEHSDYFCWAKINLPQAKENEK